MSIIKHGLAALAAGTLGIALALPAAAAPVKFDFWFGLSGDLERVVADDVQELQRVAARL